MPNDAGTFLDGISIDQRLSTAKAALSRAVVDRLAEQISVYAALPDEELRGEITRVIVTNIRLFLDMVRDPEAPTTRQIEILQEAASRRAEEGISLEAIMSAYYLGAEVCLDHVLANVRPADLPQVMVLYRRLLRYLRTATTIIANAYLSDRQASAGKDVRDSRSALLAALLDGTPAAEAAELTGAVLPACYLVMSIAVSRHPDEHAAGTDPRVAARRKVRRLRAEIERLTAGTALVSLSDGHGVVLVPSATAVAELVPADWTRMSELVDRLRHAGGADIVAGLVAAAPDCVSSAVRLAAEIREVAETSGRPPGAYRILDVLVEYQLTRPSPARDHLADLLGPLEERPDLLTTLRTYLACDLDRRKTATRLRIHPNTVDYRLQKTASLTGLDPSRGTQLPTIHAAIAARDARRAHLNVGSSAG